MKKRILLSVLSVLALCACTGQEPTSSSNTSSNDPVNSQNESSSTNGNSSSNSDTSSSTDSSSSSSSEEEKNWSETDQALMREHLYGEVLPYFDVGQNTVEYDQDYDEIVIMGSTADVTQDNLKAYAESFTSSGWFDSSDLYSSLPDNVYVFEKIIQTEQGNRYLDVQFYAVDSSTYQPTDTGIFALFAYDDREYDFPTEFFDEGIQYNTNSQLHVPSFPAEWYELSEDYYEVYCITSDTDALATYKDILEKNEFTVLEDQDEYGYYTAISKDEEFAVMYGYQAESGILDFGYLDIVLAQVPEMPSEEWPSEGLSQAFSTYAQDSTFDVPEWNGEGATYLGYEDEYNIMYYYYGLPELINYIIEVHGATEETFNNYLTALKNASWVEDKSAGEEEYKTFTKVNGDKVATIDVSFDAQKSIVYITVYLVMQDAPLEEWPSEQVKAALEDEYNQITDVVPALTNEKVTGYIFDEETDLYYADVQLLCASADVDEVFNAYVSLLTTSGWQAYDATTTDENDYLSPNKQIIVTLGKGEKSVYVSFYAAPLTSWPSTLVSKQAEIHTYTDTLPELTGENLTYEYLVNPNRYPTSYEILVTLTNADESNTVQALMEQYESKLTEASYTKSERDDLYLSDEKIYASPNKQFEVTLFISGTNTLVILVTPVVSD